MIKPVRLQLSRAKGFSIQALSLATNGLPAVNVARPSKWGNPYRADIHTAERSVAMFRRLFEIEPGLLRHGLLTIQRGNNGRGEGAVMDMRSALSSLRGKNLACWCKEGPCHADVLLQLANGADNEGGPCG